MDNEERFDEKEITQLFENNTITAREERERIRNSMAQGTLDELM